MRHRSIVNGHKKSIFVSDDRIPFFVMGTSKKPGTAGILPAKPLKMQCFYLVFSQKMKF